MMRAIDLRRLAAIDIAFLGFRFILAEHAFGVLFSIALGIFVLTRGHSVGQLVWGTYFVCLGINYVPMFAYSVSIANKQNARAELGGELMERRAAMSKYRRLSLLLLVPLVVPLVAMSQTRLGASGEAK